MRQKKILVINPIPVWGGASVGLLTVVNALRSTGKYELLILFNGFGLAYNKFTELGYECYVCSFPTIGAAGGNKLKARELIKFIAEFIISIPKLALFVKKGSFDCVYLNTGICLAPALLSRFLGIPIVWHIRELLDNRSLLGRWHCFLISALSKTVIANSESSGSVIGTRAAFSLIYDGIPEDFSNYVSPEEVKQTKKKWGFAENTMVVGLIAAISWSKGHHVLLNALSKLIKEFPMMRVVFVGGSVTPATHRKTIRARIKKLFGGYSDAEEFLRVKVNEMHLGDYVIFDGWQTGRELIRRINSCDVVAFPSTIPEGFGRPVVEGALAGKPAIGTNVGSLPELIQHGYSGWLVPTNDVDQLAKCLTEAATDLNHTKIMGERAREIALNKFTLTLQDKKILKVFDKIWSQQT